MPLSPTVLWAQRADRLLLTIDLQSCKDPQIRWGPPARSCRRQRRCRRSAGLPAACSDCRAVLWAASHNDMASMKHVVAVLAEERVL